MFHNNQTSAVTAWEYICHWAHTSDLYSPSPRSLFALCTAKKNIFCALKNHSLQIKIRPINTHHKHKCSYFLFAWSPSNSCAFTYTSLCVFKSVKILRWHRTLSSCLSLSFSYIYTAIAEWLDFKVLSQLPSYNIQPVRHFTVTYNFPCAPRPHKDRPICRWKRPKLYSLIEKSHTEKSQPERVVYLRFSLVLLKIITS